MKVVHSNFLIIKSVITISMLFNLKGYSRTLSDVLMSDFLRVTCEGVLPSNLKEYALQYTLHPKYFYKNFFFLSNHNKVVIETYRKYNEPDFKKNSRGIPILSSSVFFRNKRFYYNRLGYLVKITDTIPVYDFSKKNNYDSVITYLISYSKTFNTIYISREIQSKNHIVSKLNGSFGFNNETNYLESMNFKNEFFESNTHGKSSDCMFKNFNLNSKYTTRKDNSFDMVEEVDGKCTYRSFFSELILPKDSIKKYSHFYFTYLPNSDKDYSILNEKYINPFGFLFNNYSLSGKQFDSIYSNSNIFKISKIEDDILSATVLYDSLNSLSYVYISRKYGITILKFSSNSFSDWSSFFWSSRNLLFFGEDTKFISYSVFRNNGCRIKFQSIKLNLNSPEQISCESWYPNKLELANGNTSETFNENFKRYDSYEHTFFHKNNQEIVSNLSCFSNIVNLNTNTLYYNDVLIQIEKY